MSRLGVLAAGAAVAVAAVALTLVWALKERPFTASIPQPPPLESTALVTVRPGALACLHDATVLPDSEVAQVRVGTRGRPPVPLSVSVAGPGGYRSVTRVAPSWKDNDLISAAVRPPAHAVRGTVCVRNGGSRAVDLYASDDRAHTPATTTVDGRKVKPNFQVAFYEARPGTIAAHVGRIEQEIDAFRPAFVGPWLIWPLALLAILGPPAAIVVALRRGLEEDECP